MRLRSLQLPSFVAGLLLALGTSGALLSQRLAHGTPVTIVWSLVVMGAALGSWLTAEKRRGLPRLAAQVAGGVLGVLTVHAFFARDDAMLVETGPQWMNDAAFFAAILAAVWALKARGWAFIATVVLIAIIGLYRLTANWWHVDLFPGGAVQDFVIREILAVALGLLVFDLFWSQRSAHS